jgi:hypothetical protein
MLFSWLPESSLGRTLPAEHALVTGVGRLVGPPLAKSRELAYDQAGIVTNVV